MRYRKKPIEIDAIQYLGLSGPIMEFLTTEEYGRVSFRASDSPTERKMVISTLEGDMTCGYGDWLIRGVAGELYPCKPEIFYATYEQV